MISADSPPKELSMTVIASEFKTVHEKSSLKGVSLIVASGFVLTSTAFDCLQHNCHLKLFFVKLKTMVFVFGLVEVVGGLE